MVFRAVMVVLPLPEQSADEPAPLRYFHNLRVLKIGWLGIFNKPTEVKGFQFPTGAMVSIGFYG